MSDKREHLYLYRVYKPGLEVRAEGDDADPVMAGHFAVFDQWTEIDSIFEGRFMERFSPGAFSKTISEQRDGMRVLFQHGFDPDIGDKPLGPIRTLREDSDGAYYEVPLLNAAYVREQVLPGLREGLYGASFRFRVLREEVEEEPGRSEHNPNGIPERTVKEAEVREFGPVTFPAYAGASAGVRSLPDEMLLRFASGYDEERLRSLAESFNTSAQEGEEAAEGGQDAPPEDSAEAEPHPDPGRREIEREPVYGTASQDKAPSWRL